MTAKVYHRTLIQIEVLSAYDIGELSFENILRDGQDGDLSIDINTVAYEEVDEAAIGRLLIQQRSDPEFLIDPAGTMTSGTAPAAESLALPSMTPTSRMSTATSTAAPMRTARTCGLFRASTQRSPGPSSSFSSMTPATGRPRSCRCLYRSAGAACSSGPATTSLARGATGSAYESSPGTSVQKTN